MRFLLTGLATSVALLPLVNAWGAAGHEIVATIAQVYLHPSVLPKLCDILDFHGTNPNEPPCHLASIATWADKNRWHMRWSAPLHYVGAYDDYPPQTCAFPGPKGWRGREGINVLNGIRNTTAILQDYVKDKVSLDTANEAFKFLVHFMGDAHQPLHLVSRARGGNSIKVLFDGRQTKLHTLWDSLLIAKSLRTIPRNYTRPLPMPEVEFSLRGAIYDPYIRRIVWEGLSDKWRDDIPDWLSCPTLSPSSLKLSGPEKSTFISFFHHAVNFLINFILGRLELSSPALETDDDILCPYAWSKPIQRLNCDFIWPAALDEPPYSHSSYSPSSDYVADGHNLTPDDEFGLLESATFVGLNESAAKGGPYLELDTPEYVGMIHDEWVVEKLLAQAAIRLAATLNGLFADTEGEEWTEDSPFSRFLVQSSGP